MKNNKIILSLMIIAVLALGTMPRMVDAAVRKSNPRPVIFSLNPNPIYWGGDGKGIKVYGDGFARGAVVRINNSDRTTNFVNAQRITFDLIDTDTLRLGDYVVTVVNPGPGGGVSNAIILKIVEEVEAVSTPATVYRGGTSNGSGSTTAKTATKATTTVKEDDSAKSEETVSDLTASAIFGESGFLPDSLVEWLILATLILLIVIVFRRIFREPKYQEIPLKHA